MGTIKPLVGIVATTSVNLFKLKIIVSKATMHIQITTIGAIITVQTKGGGAFPNVDDFYILLSDAMQNHLVELRG